MATAEQPMPQTPQFELSDLYNLGAPQEVIEKVSMLRAENSRLSSEIGLNRRLGKPFGALEMIMNDNEQEIARAVAQWTRTKKRKIQ